MVEDDHQDNALGNDRNVNVVLFPLVEEDGEFLFTDQLGETTGRRDVARLSAKRGWSCRGARFRHSWQSAARFCQPGR